MPKKILRKIELLCPAGDLERLRTAVVFGADAVYCGLPEWSLRNPREITFNLKTLKEGIEFAHKRGVRVYLTFNIFPHENQLEGIEKILKNIKEILKNIDGIIVSDLGMFALVKKYLPEISIHISTQANTLNSEAVKMWGKLGANRIVLARETTLKEIKDIKKDSKIELEVFGHGAMCMAYSGRCLLSKYFTGREANLGDCAQSCRWRYKIKSQISNNKLQTNSKSQIQNNNEAVKQCDNKYFLEEETRPGNLIEVQEDANGTYFMNSKEICSLDILDKFIEAGIDSLKIEGRAKTVYYLATVTRAYRKAIDAYYLNKKTYKHLIKELVAELNLIQNRGYSHGFLLGRHNYEQEYKIAAFKPPILFIGIIQNVKYQISNVKNKVSLRDNIYLVEVKNKFKVGERVEIVTPDKIFKSKILKIRTEKGKELEEVLTPQEKVWVKFDLKENVPERSILRRRTK